jgi:ribosome-binding protein aMBF1 (putative translation factor)
MKTTKRKALEKRGWRVGSAQDFLALSDEEATIVELKLAMAKLLRERRADSHLSQEALAKLLRSSQSRVAKMEAGDHSVSIELLLRALLRLGTTKRELAKLIATAA